jgi:uncharacterized membrane protein (UPF0127 family)
MSKNTKKEPEVKKNEAGYLKFVLIAVIIIAGGYLLISSFFDKPEVPIKQPMNNQQQQQQSQEPQFKKHGELEFLKAGNKKVIKKIDIEVANNDNERMLGLMYRKSMDEMQGMLFIFPVQEEQSFWMKNTYISLDILYVNDKKEIVKIYKNTTPKSTASLRSFKEAIYVVETIAGFTDKYDVKEGDFIKFDYKK